jgi:hypothetical protein
MSQERPCTYCGHSFVISADRCYHCGQPGHYPNVYVAALPDEVDALQRRYQLAQHEAAAREADAVLADFENEITGTRAVIARSSDELQRLLTSDKQIYATFYQLLEAGIRLPDGEKWDVLRGVADEALFSGYKQHIRFAALTLDGMGLKNYGDCFIVLRTEMIAHRASVFDENSVLFMEHHDIKMSEAHKLPRGYRATWTERAKLCVAKLGAKIDATTPAGAYSGLLLRQGTTSEEDDFVEVHIWGPMTIRTVEQVTLNPHTKRPARAIKNRANRERLAKFGVTIR